MADNKGQVPTGITTTDQEVSSTAANICAQLVSTYLAALPSDPSVNNGASVTNCAAAYSTGYNIVRSAANSRITVTSPVAELSQVISVMAVFEPSCASEKVILG